MVDKKLTNEEILRMIEEFSSLTSDEKKKLKIAQGSENLVYNSPANPDYVIKSPKKQNIFGVEDQVKNYIAAKKMQKYAPTEVPTLVRQGENSYLIQKKLPKLFESEDDFRQSSAYDLIKDLKRQGVDTFESDLHKGNIALDSQGNAKIIDQLMPRIEDRFDSDKKIANSLKNAEKNIISKVLKNSDKTRIYRSVPLIGPAIGAGIAAMSGDANAASGLPVLGEAESLGPEQGSEDWEIENPQANPAARRAALEKLRR